MFKVSTKVLKTMPVIKEEKETELNDFRPYRHIKIEVKEINYFLSSYINQCRKLKFKDGHVTEVRMLKNLVKRYSDNDLLKEEDIELLILILQTNQDDCSFREDRYLHDVLVSRLLKDLDLEEYVKQKGLFKLSEIL